ncbi:MAG: hypothetical protein A3E98_01705 [Candidatus Doudnabacteria bacterium RIFCSPHIGHO2_12_FULL_48_11]|uniref:Uncharacterized protein n=1 Tax=Candidatus Doudnabacteria bacterium RIFCSPHIGHO2_01_FULL_46_24 TaxID=1817825 RepID=A0A1F5NV11_9BACT|nr:MAG: hypothetical protein A2720_01475 [Candidatus Doudnabacteria bacterium RIFCSPHIGHO2_01_FULL_46_24]OGE93962.1 MAG: hypothetical protein A3E98_01705 [Candidatus Doudnabacteria bacterium RIFCSPHIGHO2_12_FULL_48_11]
MVPRLTPIGSEIQTMIDRAALAPVVDLTLSVLDELAKWHRHYLEYLRYYDQRKAAMAETLAFYKTLKIRVCPLAIHKKIKRIIAELSAIPLKP